MTGVIACNCNDCHRCRCVYISHLCNLLLLFLLIVLVYALSMLTICILTIFDHRLLSGVHLHSDQSRDTQSPISGLQQCYPLWFEAAPI